MELPAPARCIAWAALIACVAFCLGGCAKAEVREVNNVAIARRISYTDEDSRALARRTFELAAQQREDYRVGPEDVIEISVFEWELRGQTRAVEVRIEESGHIVLPVLETVAVGGKTVQEIKAQLQTEQNE